MRLFPKGFFVLNIGFAINNEWFFHRLPDHQLFEDGYFFNLSDYDDGFQESRPATDNNPVVYEMFRSSGEQSRQDQPPIPKSRVSSPYSVEDAYKTSANGTVSRRLSNNAW